MFSTLLSLMLLGATPAEVKTSQTPTTRLYVETTPAGATIRVDGKTQGTSPKTIIVAPGAGKLTVEVELDGHATKRQEVTIQGGRVTRIQFSFASEVPEPKYAGPATAPPASAEAVFDKGTVLHDGFQGKFDLPWRIIRADPSHYSLTKNPGRLTITTQRGTIYGDVQRNALNLSALAKNIFLIPNPLPDGGDFRVTMAVSQFRPSAAYHQVALICYNDDATYLKWSCEYNRNRTQASATIFGLVRQTNSEARLDAIAGLPNPGPFWMRITKHLNQYECAYSTDGREFKVAGNLPWGDRAPKYVGFLAKNGGNPDAPDIDVCIDSFDLVSTSKAAFAVPRGTLYTVPEGGVDQLVTFIQRLSEYKPKTPEDDLPYRVYFRRAIGEAAQKILKLEKDPNSEACQVARIVLLANRVYAFAQGDPQQQKKTLADLRAYLEEQVNKGQGEVGAGLATLLGQTLEQMGEYQRAADALKGFAELIAKSGDKNLSGAAADLTRTAERLAAAAKEFPREDQKLVLPPKGKLFPLDLSRQTNMDIVTFDTPGGGSLTELPLGDNTLDGVKFHVGPKVIQIASSAARNRPEKVEGIAVDRKIVRFYVLHASQTSWVPGGTRVGEYRLHYEDGSSATFPIVYGEDLRDWWCGEDHFPATRAKVVWTGNNIRAAQARNTLRLCMRAWENPHPDKKVTSLDYVSTSTRCAPFCVAITVEEPDGAR